MTTHHIIVFTIGSPQSYISQARRTHDLFQGSRILSYLAGVGVYTAHEIVGYDAVIYPKLKAIDTKNGGLPKYMDYANVPNRIVIKVSDSKEKAIDCAEKMEKAIKAAWKQISNSTRDHALRVIPNADRKVAADIWDQQRDTWLECFWIVEPYVANPQPRRTLYDKDCNPTEQSEYGANMEAANTTMGARKLMRNFPPINEVGRKDSITGEHAVLHGEKMSDVKFWEFLKDKHPNLAMLKSSERLGGISATKRFAHEEQSSMGINRSYFAQDKTYQPTIAENLDVYPLIIQHRYPSTSSIASASFKYDVLKHLGTAPDLLKALKKYVAALEDSEIFKDKQDLYFMRRGNYNIEHFPFLDREVPFDYADDELRILVQKFRSIDGDYLYEDTLIAKTIEEYSGQPPSAKALRTLQSARNELVREAGNLDIPPPHPYLAILSMDGDSMGKTLSALQTEEEHSAFSDALKQFAENDVERLVEKEYLGRLVYAGGDDVLALVSVRHALTVAEQLRVRFEAKMKAIEIEKDGQKTLIQIKNHEGDPVTVSTGLAFVHHTYDLQSAVRAANSAQKDIAKDDYERDAIGIQFLRRSGEQRIMGSKWCIREKDDGKTNEPTECFINLCDEVRELISVFSSDELSRSLPSDIAEIAYRMSNVFVPVSARFAELERLIKRRLSDDAKSKSKRITEIIQRLVLQTSDQALLQIFEAEKDEGKRVQAVQDAINTDLREELNEILENFTDEFLSYLFTKYPTEDELKAFLEGKSHKALGIVNKYNAEIQRRWEAAQRWTELARFIAQKESDR